MKTIQTALVLIFGGMVCTPRVCEGFISYSWVNQGMYVAHTPVSYSLDFNGDSIIDLLFESNGMWFDVASPNANSLVIAGDGDVHALSDGYSIGPDVESDLWLQDPLGLTLNTCAVLPPPFGVTCGGEFLETTAYMGVQFHIDEFLYYGWVRISNPYDGISGGVIMDFAYETEAGVGILAGAGAVPEPATTALITTGCILLALRRKKK